MPPERREIAVSDLRLDPENPRLPEELQGAEQGDLLTYLRDEGVLEELMGSFADNGFFEHEPLIAYEDPEVGFVVVEGNRRLAALKIILREPEAVAEELEPTLDEPLPEERRAELQEIPVYVVADRDEVHKYLGYRHIGGIKTWSAESKARYLMLETDRAASNGVDAPFLEVARRVGSNTQGVRNSYTAIRVLRHARDEFGIDVVYVVENRFGVWSRCMTAGVVRGYIGLDYGSTYEEVQHNITQTEEEGLREVIGDLSPNGDRPLLNDSRDVTVYGRILVHPVAREVLRQYHDLSVARQVVELAELPDRIDDLRARVEVARSEAERADFSQELMDASDALFRATRSLRATVRELVDEDNE